LAALLLLSCAATPPNAAPADSTAGDNAATGSSSCNAEAAQSVVGKAATPELIEQARSQAGAKTVRVIKPGDVVTMEYLDTRLNINVDAGNVVTRLNCG